MSDELSEGLSRRARRFGALLRETDPAVPPLAFPAERIARAGRRRSRVRWRMAAAVGVLAVALLGVKPVRAWMLNMARALWGATAGVPRATPPSPAPGAAASRVTFRPTESTFALRVARPQARGTLTIEITAALTADAAIAGGGGGADLVVLPDGLRILNDSGSTASYVVRLPASLARVEVAVAGGSPRLLVPKGPGAHWVLDLGSAP